MPLTIGQKRLLSKLQLGWKIQSVGKDIWIENPDNLKETKYLHRNTLNGLVTKGVIDKEYKLVG